MPIWKSQQVHMRATHEPSCSVLLFAIAGWSLGKFMEGSAPRKRKLHIAAFPEELLHIIFSKLDLKDKLNAGLVCKEWDKLLKSCTGAARHWDIKYSVKRTLASTNANKKDFRPWLSSVSLARWASLCKHLTSQQGVRACQFPRRGGVWSVAHVRHTSATSGTHNLSS